MPTIEQHAIDPATQTCLQCGEAAKDLFTLECTGELEKPLLAKLKGHSSPSLAHLLASLDRTEVKAMMAAFGRYTIRATVNDLAVKRAREKAKAQLERME